MHHYFRGSSKLVVQFVAPAFQHQPGGWQMERACGPTGDIARMSGGARARDWWLSGFGSYNVEGKHDLVFCGDGSAGGRNTFHLVVAVPDGELASRRYGVSIK